MHPLPETTHILKQFAKLPRGVLPKICFPQYPVPFYDFYVGPFMEIEEAGRSTATLLISGRDLIRNNNRFGPPYRTMRIMLTVRRPPIRHVSGFFSVIYGISTHKNNVTTALIATFPHRHSENETEAPNRPLQFLSLQGDLSN